MPIRKNCIYLEDCQEILKDFPQESIAACITDPPYNYEFIGHNWNNDEINRRLERIQDSNTLVKNIPYGSGLAGGVRNKRWYERNRENILEYQRWCVEWGEQVFRVCKSGAFIGVFSSTRTVAHVQVALEEAGFYARDILVYRRHSGIPRGLNAYKKLSKDGDRDAEKWKGWHSCLRNEWEAIVILQKPLINNYIETIKQTGVGLLHAINEDGSFQSNILEDYQNDKTEKFNEHYTVKPFALMKKLIELMVPKSDENIILDPFAGSGTTLVAAQSLGYPYIGIEIEPLYIPIIENRLKENGQPRETEQETIFNQMSFL
jgi:site-specific DNA-methyltransferase (adenine-specific)